MLLGLSALLFQRALHLALFKQRKGPSPRWQAWANPLLLLVLALAAFFAVIARSNSAQCLEPSWSGVGVLALLLLLSALARARLVAVVIGSLWILALLMAFRDRGNTCGQSLTHSVSASLQTAGAQIERQAKEMVTYDQDADIVSTGATKHEGEQRVSLAQALEHPSRYFSCAQASSDASARPIEIYLGESALFGFNSDRLNAEAEANLGKLSELIAHNPQASIVLTGHTDKLGVPLLNIKLSEQRAKRIAEWLVTHKVLPAEQIDVRGAGDRDPVVDDPALYRMNRRVEMHIDCPEVTSPPVAPSAAGQSGTSI
jgi:outer membrane protein OmpA-like peptidoglycan-associated protein